MAVLLVVALILVPALLGAKEALAETAASGAAALQAGQSLTGNGADSGAAAEGGVTGNGLAPVDGPNGANGSAGSEDSLDDDEPSHNDDSPAAMVNFTWLFFKITESGNDLPGAQIELRNVAGKALSTFESCVDGVELTQALAVGETYTLHEVAAPAGYALADDLAFCVQLDQDGEPYLVQEGSESLPKDNQTLVMVDRPLAPLFVEKHDSEGKPLTGARLKLWDKTAEAQVDAWTSAEEPHEVSGELLVAGHAYQLVEEKSPEGYEVVGPVDFSLDRAGKVTGLVGDAATVDKNGLALALANRLTPKPEDPEEPDDPKDQEEPTDPVDPKTPTEPQKPVTPTKTTTPKKSDSPKPATSQTTTEPIAPKASSTQEQEQPKVASITAKPQESVAATPDAELPKTGDEGGVPDVPLVVGGALVGLGAVILLNRGK